jgi:TonB family protein
MAKISTAADQNAPSARSTRCVPPSDSPEFDLDLLYHWEDEDRTRRWRWCLGASLAIHALVFVLGLGLKSVITGTSVELPARARAYTKLYIPPDLLTQRAPNTRPPSKTFDLAELLAAQRAQQQVAARVRGSVRRFELPKTDSRNAVKPIIPKIEVEAPAPLGQSANPPAGLPDSLVAAAPPPPAPAPNPTPPKGADEPKNKATSHLAPPKNSVDDVIQQMTKHDGNSSTVVVSDENATKVAPSMPGSQGSQGHINSAIELQTDPQGADFKPYLARILSIVRRNWFNVLPTSAQMGVLSGRTVIQFVVNRDGSIPKLVIADSSGAPPLDRAAVAGLSMSNPLPPLPPEFKGAYIRLQFSFSYNMPSS